MHADLNLAVINRNRISTRAASGVTLVELLIVLVVLAILATVAVGNYTDYLTRSRRSEAIVALTEMANLQNQFFANNLTYAATLASLPYDASSTEGSYTLTIPGASVNGFIVRASAVGNQATDDPDCAVFQLTSLGVRTPADCW